MFFNLTMDDLSPNRTAHKLDKECSVCSTSLGFGMIHNKKHYWCPSHSRFCYRGVCAKCAGHQVRHPESQTMERCCNPCYTKFLSMSIQAEKNAEIREIKVKSGAAESKLQLEEQQRENEDRKRVELETEVNRLKEELIKNESNFLAQKSTLEKEIEAVTTESNEMLASVQLLEQELESAQREFSQAEIDLKAITFELANNNVKANELKSRLLEQEHENEALRQRLEEKVESPVVPASDSGKKSKQFDELKKAVEIANLRQVQLQQEQLDLTRRLEEAQRILKSKESQLASLQTVGQNDKELAHVFGSSSDVRKLEEMTELKEKINILRQENDRLRSQLEAADAKGQDEVVGPKTAGGPQRAETCPKCSLF